MNIKKIISISICFFFLNSCFKSETEFHKLVTKLEEGTVYFQKFDNPEELVQVNVSELINHSHQINVTKYKAVGMLIFKNKVNITICKIRTNRKIFGPIGNEYYIVPQGIIPDLQRVQ